MDFFYEDDEGFDPKTLVKSPVFTAINVMIDQKLKEMNGLLLFLKDEVARAYDPARQHFPLRINTRISYEEGGRQEVEIAADLRTLERVAEMIRDVKVLSDAIHKLQVFKLELCNDWDFTKGDLSTQKAVFGEA